MTERERFIKALKREPIEGHCPTFELVFYLTLEAIGKIHPSQQRFDQWKQMSKAEQRLHMEYMADSYIDVAEKYHHSAIFVHPNPGDFENTLRLLDCIREKTADRYFLMMHGDCTFEIPNGNTMLAFSERMYEDEEGLKKEAQHNRAGKQKSRHPSCLVDDGTVLSSGIPLMLPGMLRCRMVGNDHLLGCLLKQMCNQRSFRYVSVVFRTNGEPLSV